MEPEGFAPALAFAVRGEAKKLRTEHWAWDGSAINMKPVILDLAGFHDLLEY